MRSVRKGEKWAEQELSGLPAGEGLSRFTLSERGELGAPLDLTARMSLVGTAGVDESDSQTVLVNETVSEGNSRRDKGGRRLQEKNTGNRG